MKRKEENKSIKDKRKVSLIEDIEGLESFVLEKPLPPAVSEVTHSSIEINWLHIKTSLPKCYRFKYILQEASEFTKDQWKNNYSGFGITKLLVNLKPLTIYKFRICVVNALNERSEYSDPLSVSTIAQPLTGEELHKAIATENLNEVVKLLSSESGPKIREIPDKFGNQPIMIAVNRNNIDILQTLIDHGSNVNVKTSSGKTPLMLAAFSGKLNICKTLRVNGATYDHRDSHGCTVLHYAVDGGNVTVIKWILMDGHEIDPVDESGWTPLLRSCSIEGSVQVAQALLGHKAKVDVEDNEKLNPLTIAIINNNLFMVKLLVENRADFLKPNSNGKTPYELADSMEKKNIVAFFDSIIEKNGLKKY